MVAATYANAGGLLALLAEDGDVELQTYALQKLNENLDAFWAEISDYIPKIEMLHESSSLPLNVRELAALVVSKLYYHLGALDESLAFALRAGTLFDLSQRNEYVNTVVEKCIDVYVELRCKADSIDPDVFPNGDKRMRVVVERMFERCMADKEYKQIIGIALESRRLDTIEKVLHEASDPSLLSYVMEAALTTVPLSDLRKKILRTLIPFYSNDYFSLTQCFVHLNDPSLATNLLRSLVKANDEDKSIVACQICFDLVETASQEFLSNVRKGLGANEAQVAEQDGMQIDEAAAAAQQSSEKVDPDFEPILNILFGHESGKLYLHFLQRNNHTDLLILSQTKEALDARMSINNSALTFSHAYAQAGTTSEEFLRNNLDWLHKASAWSKFSATSALGVIHKGNVARAFNILDPYLPKQDVSQGSFYSEGGSLYALGLIHANHGREVLSYLRRHLRNQRNEVLQHGAALGLGVAGMASGNEAIYEDLKGVLYEDNEVAGEAAGYAMGLVMLGTASQTALEEMLRYAQETQHEKIIRALGIGMSLLFVGLQEEADWLIERLCSDKDPLLRYGGIYTIAMAYAGTGKNKAIKQLLHVAVSDVNDDVRRAAVMGLGFILFNDPEQVPRVVQLLSESYNPNVRYGATLALGISCAGTGLMGAIDILEPMTKDSTDFVRQGASIALAMIMIQQNETMNSRVGIVRKGFANTIGEKHEDPMAKFGAAVAQGIIDAGGRNMTISLQSKFGSPNIPAIAGMAMFTQFWYWFPCAHFLSLAFNPTAVIGVTKNLKVPKLTLISKARPSLFSYYPPTTVKQKETVEQAAAPVTLSTTAKATARQKTKDKEKAEAMEAMETDEKLDEPEKENKEEKVQEGTEEGTGEQQVGGQESSKPPSKRQRQEPSFDELPNLSRVVPAQLPCITFGPDSKYVPFRPLVPSAGGSMPRSTATSTPSSKTPASNNGLVTTSSSSMSLLQSSLVKLSASTSASQQQQQILQQQLLSYGNRASGGIIVLRDVRPEQEAEFIDLEPPTPPVQEGSTTSTADQTQPMQQDDDAADATAEIASVPPPFEYPFDDAAEQ